MRAAATAERAREAAVCGALGCSEREPLYRVESPSKGERVLCGAHVRRLLGSGAPSFKSDGTNEPSSTGRTHTTLSGSGKRPGRRGAPNTVLPTHDSKRR